jgi:5-methylcytosine-specific restriction endonuclease McrA
MTPQFAILLITGGLIYNTYYDNFIINNFKQYTKYYKIGLIAVMAMGVLIIMNRNPSESWSMMNALKQYINVVPIDRSTKDLINPLLSGGKDAASQRIETSGKHSNKRSVSETKKKYVASHQNWKCQKCRQQLTAWFEVDHVKRLDQGGTNDINNLVALCRNCHGEKTSMENI